MEGGVAGGEEYVPALYMPYNFIDHAPPAVMMTEHCTPHKRERRQIVKSCSPHRGGRNANEWNTTTTLLIVYFDTVLQ